MDIKALINRLADQYKYRPLPKKIRDKTYGVYYSDLNGFDSVDRECIIDGVVIARNYKRVVVGDYGAYVEIPKESLLINPEIEQGQEWRVDKDYLDKNNLSIKYEWYVYKGKKIYYQLAGVKYADYVAGYYYISVLDFDKLTKKENIMAGPANARNGETIRPKFNWWSVFDHALGTYIRGEDGCFYLNGGWSHIMAWSGRGNTFKSFVLDQAHATIATRYKFEWWSKYDTEVSAELSRSETALRAAYRANHWDYNFMDHSLESQIHTGSFVFNAADSLQGQDWWSTFIRDEVENRHKVYVTGKNLRETPFPDPIRKKNRKILNPWLYALDSLSEWHSESVEKSRDKADIGDGDQNSLAMKDAKDKSDMMGRWPGALGRGHMYIGFTVHLSDGIQMGRYAPDKKLDNQNALIKFSGVPARALTFLTNSLIVATASGDMVADKSYDATRGVTAPEYPTVDSRGMLSATNDLKVIRYTQYRAKSGPTGVKFDMIFSQEEGMLVGLSEWHYIRTVLKGAFGLTRTGNFFELPLYPGKKYQRTTIRSEIDSDHRLKRALEITAAIAYMQNNWMTLDEEFKAITANEIYDKVVEAGFSWDEILDDTVEYWMFMDQYDEKNQPPHKHATKGGKRTLTAMSILHMACRGLKPPFLTCSKK